MKWFSVFMLSIILWVLILLSFVGCTIDTHKPNKDRVVAVIDLVDTLPPRVMGNAQTINGVCKVDILKSNYPHCITHEIMHCFEGDWHKGKESNQYCY